MLNFEIYGIKIKLKELPKYKLINKLGPSHNPIFTVSLSVLDYAEISAKGYSIREAEKKAAKKILSLLNEK